MRLTHSFGGIFEYNEPPIIVDSTLGPGSCALRLPEPRQYDPWLHPTSTSLATVHKICLNFLRDLPPRIHSHLIQYILECEQERSCEDRLRDSWNNTLNTVSNHSNNDFGSKTLPP